MGQGNKKKFNRAKGYGPGSGRGWSGAGIGGNVGGFGKNNSPSGNNKSGQGGNNPFGKKGFGDKGQVNFSGLNKFFSNLFSGKAYADAMGQYTGKQTIKKPPSQWKINQFLKHNIDIANPQPGLKINIDTARAIDGMEDGWKKTWLKKWTPQAIKNLKINHQMYYSPKIKPGDPRYTPQGTGSAKIDPKAEKYLEWMARQNPTGTTVSEMKKIYANNLKDGKHTLQQVMKMNPANTIPFYALIDDTEESTPTKNDSVKVNNTKENKNMSMGPLITSAAKAAIPLTVGSKKKTYKSNATTADQKRLDTLYQKHFDRSGDHTTKGGASYWIDEHKPKTDADWANIDRMLGASAEAKSPGNLGGVSRDSSTMFQGDKGQEYLDSFRGDGSLVGLNSANTLNQIAANTGQAGNYFQQSDQGIIDRIDKAVNPPVTTQPIIEDPKPVTPEPGKEKGGMDDFMKFLMLMSVMGGGRGGGGGYGGSQFGYGGLNPGGVQAAYNPLESLKGMGDWFKTNFGSGVSGGSGLDVAKT